MKKIASFKGWGIYEANAKEISEGAYNYSAFLPDESPANMSSPEFSADNTEELKENIRSY